MNEKRRLSLDLEVGDTVRMIAGGQPVLLTLDRKRGSRVKMSFVADVSVRILKDSPSRQPVYEPATAAG